MKSSASYQYSPLSEPDSIRLLELQPDTSSDADLRGKLTISALSKEPQYEAVSYVWGDNTVRQYMFCDDESLEITANLAAALRKFRHLDRPRHLWVDAICINQSDVSERNQQVAQMSHVYSDAQQVLVWLGDADNKEVAKALRLIHLFTQPDFQEASIPIRINQVQHIEQDEWSALGALLRMPWFERTWIIQEVGMAKRALVSVADHTIGWEQIETACWIIFNSFFETKMQAGGLNTGVHTITTINTFRQQTSVTQDHILLERLAFTRFLHRATDPRDKVFGLLVFFDDTIQAVKPNYSISVEDLYHRLAVEYLTNIRNLCILSHVSLPSDESQYSCPSWVPDWRVPGVRPFTTCLTSGSYQASGSMPADFHFHDRILTVRASFCDTIEKLCTIPPVKLPPPEDCKGQTHEEILFSVLMQKWRRILECRTLALESPSNAGYEAFLRTFVFESPVKEFSLTQAQLVMVHRIVQLADVNFCGTSDDKDRESSELRQEDTEEMFQLEAIHDICAGYRNFCVTSHGRYGWVPNTTQVGDNVLVIYGLEAPFVVRTLKDGHQLHGECYVYGLMNGEGLSEEGLQSQMVSLI